MKQSKTFFLDYRIGAGFFNFLSFVQDNLYRTSVVKLIKSTEA